MPSDGAGLKRCRLRRVGEPARCLPTGYQTGGDLEIAFTRSDKFNTGMCAVWPGLFTALGVMQAWYRLSQSSMRSAPPVWALMAEDPTTTDFRAGVPGNRSSDKIDKGRDFHTLRLNCKTINGKKAHRIDGPGGQFRVHDGSHTGGADSVYFGIEQLNMRARATMNFTLDDLEAVSELCRQHGVKSTSPSIRFCTTTTSV